MRGHMVSDEGKESRMMLVMVVVLVLVLVLVVLVVVIRIITIAMFTCVYLLGKLFSNFQHRPLKPLRTVQRSTVASLSRP